MTESRTDVPEEGARARKPYHRAHSRTGPIYPWTHTAEGRAAKIIIGLLGDETQGAQALFERFVRLCPEFAAEYERVRGVPLSPAIVFNRYHKQYYYKGRSGEPSPEHYTRDPKLCPTSMTSSAR